MAMETEIQLNVTSLIYPDNIDLSPKLSDSDYDIQTIKELVDKYIKVHGWDNKYGISVTYIQNSLGDRSIVFNTNMDDVYAVLGIALDTSRELYPDISNISEVKIEESSINIREIIVTR